MNELNINSLSDFVLNAQILWAKGLESVAANARTSGLFREDRIPQNTGNTRKYSEIDLEQFAAYKGEGDQAARARVQQGYSKELTLYRVALNIGITYEMRTQGKYLDIQRSLTNLGATVKQRLELDLSHRFTFGTATTYTDRDGRTIDISTGDTKALFATDHAVRGSSTTYRNRLANNPQFSRGSLEAMELMRVENTINQFGEKMAVKDDIIWCTDDPNTNNAIDEVLRSTTNPTQNNAGVVNTYTGKYRKVVLPYVATTASGAVDTTKRKYWGTASTMVLDGVLGMHEEPNLKVPNAGSSAEDFSTDNWDFAGRGGWGICIPSGRGYSLSTGDGTA